MVQRITSLAALREGFESALNVLADLNVYRYLPDVLATPAAVVRRSEAMPRGSFGKVPVYRFDVTLLASRSDAVAGQEQIDLWLSRSNPESLIDALEADRSLGGVAHTLSIEAIGGDEVVTVGDVEHVATTLTVVVYPSHSTEE